jgi:ABC-2 type transport system permease protein
MSSVVYVMWIRQLKRYWRSKARMIGTLGQPILFLVALGYGLGAVFQQAGQGNYIEFLAPGIIAMSILFTAMFNGIEIIWDRQFGFLKETLVAPVPRIKIMIGRTLGGATVAFFQGIFIGIISLFLGFHITNFMNIPFVLVFMFLTAFLFTAIGIAIASLLKDLNAFPLIINFVIMPLFFLSGALFPINDAPNLLKTIIKINPLSYGVDGIRGSFLTSTFGLHVDFIVLVIWIIAASLIGSYFFSKIEI